jgi:hypothetical protein
MMSRIDSRHWSISTGCHFQNGHHNTAKIQHCPISSQFDMWVDNDHIWNGVEIGQCWICVVLWRPFWKWRPVEIFQCRESIRDIIIYPHQNGHHNIAKNQHCPISSQFDMWVDNDVPNWFPTLINFHWLPFSKCPPQYRKKSKMVTGRNFAMSGINSGHHYLPTYEILMISDNVEFLWYCGGHFENGDQ